MVQNITGRTEQSSDPCVTTDSSGWNGIYGMHRADLLNVLAASLPARHHTHGPSLYRI